jgi:tight adherence protein B
MHPIILGLIIFVVTVSIIELILYSRRMITRPDRQYVKRRLKQLPAQKQEAVLNSILREDAFSDVPFLNRVLKHFSFIHKLKRLKEQANAQYSVSFFLLFSLTLAVVGGILASVFGAGIPGLVFMIGAGACLPWAFLMIKKRKRMERFRHQLPEAMELIARSLKAGHAFSSGLKLAADQMEDPISIEFAATIHEINFGVSVSDALRHMAERVDCADLQIFVVSVIMQRETGGNLAEIMESNARIIRERFKFYNHVRTLSAEGRLSGMVLFMLPIVVFLAIQLVNPEYMKVMYTSSLGQNLLWTAGIMMVVGMLVIKRMVVIEA